MPRALPQGLPAVCDSQVTLSRFVWLCQLSPSGEAPLGSSAPGVLPALGCLETVSSPSLLHRSDAALRWQRVPSVPPRREFLCAGIPFLPPPACSPMAEAFAGDTGGVVLCT